MEVVRVDARCSGLDPGFDRVLVDVPCTGLGRCAVGRRPAGGASPPTSRR
ncbi:ribosomal RNA small subunit methyltransferase B domain protein [Mycobacterium xenopi 4042]|uniref:Ribosomal RNA small subunit methyltransferase B domain protein n=1 Tax=Mycobacterium xenopi 4042 TaxID=1299334 RepID=X7ZIV4_MYCXE|nr:ribosomal RNA small subunit methyltransferase B domain protein [Mycobacterium xenopi 4042]